MLQAPADIVGRVPKIIESGLIAGVYVVEPNVHGDLRGRPGG